MQGIENKLTNVNSQIGYTKFARIAGAKHLGDKVFPFPPPPNAVPNVCRSQIGNLLCVIPLEPRIVGHLLYYWENFKPLVYVLI